MARKNGNERKPGTVETGLKEAEEGSVFPLTLNLIDHSQNLEDLLSFLNQLQTQEAQVSTQDQGIINPDMLKAIIKEITEVTDVIHQLIDESNVRAFLLDEKLSAYDKLTQEASDHVHVINLTAEIFAQAPLSESLEIENTPEDRLPQVFTAFLERVGGLAALLDVLLKVDDRLENADKGYIPDHSYLSWRFYFFTSLLLETSRLAQDEERNEQTSREQLNEIAEREEDAFYAYADYLINYSHQINVKHLFEVLNALYNLAKIEEIDEVDVLKHERHKVLREAFQALKDRILAENSSEAQAAREMVNEKETQDLFATPENSDLE